MLVNYTSLTFVLKYTHIKAHQDDHDGYDVLERPSQLYCLCNDMTKGVVWGLAGKEYPNQKMFPLEPLAILIGTDTLTIDMTGELRFWVRKQIAETVFYKLRLMSPRQFHEIA